MVQVDSIRPDTVVATMYGGVLLYRGYCVTCQQNAFVERGQLVCCSEPYKPLKVIQARLASIVDGKNRNTVTERETLVKEQGGLCFYCLRPFWSDVKKSGKVVTLKSTLDHFVPFSYCQSELGRNKVAACHVCNALKMTTVFIDVETAREYLAIRWHRKGFSDLEP